MDICVCVCVCVFIYIYRVRQKKRIHTLTKENSTLYNRFYNIFPSTQQYDICIYFSITYQNITKPGLSPGFVMHKGIPIAIVRLRHKKL